MGPLFLVNWQVMNVRFRALMWLLAIALAVVILLSSVPKQRHAHRPPRAWPMLSAGLRGKP